MTELSDVDIRYFVDGARSRNERGEHSSGDLIVLAQAKQIEDLRRRWRDTALARRLFEEDGDGPN